MTMNIGIYEREEDVLIGIQLLREAGIEQGELRVVVSNREGAPLLTSNTDVPLEELDAIQETRRNTEGDIFPLGGPLVTGYPAGNAATNSGPAGVVFPALIDDEGPSSEEVLTDIGIPKNAAEECGKAVESGHYLLIAESDLDTNVEVLLRNTGASSVVH